MNSFPSAMTRLDDLVVVDVSGPDAAAFLQGQLTQDISGPNACLAGYCSPKGRLTASMIVWHEPDAATPSFRVLVKQSIAEALVRRLTKFVMRAKVAVGITPARVFGAAVTEPREPLPADAGPYSVRRTEHGTWVAAPSATEGTQRWWFIARDTGLSCDDHAVRQDANDGAKRNDGTEPDTGHGANDTAPAQAAWRAQDIAAGLGWVVAGIEELFIPQTLNMDITGGVSFTKGCYPGQEIVARSHYRGTIKRRMAYGTVAGDAAEPRGAAAVPRADIFDANRPDAPCGRVINAASTDATHLLFEATLADLDTADFRLAGPAGPAIKLAGLPYDIKAG
jgi:folate-binding protein YgfZ